MISYFSSSSFKFSIILSLSGFFFFYGLFIFFNNSLKPFLGSIVGFFVFLFFLFIFTTFKEIYYWNNGFCRKTNKPWILQKRPFENHFVFFSYYENNRLDNTSLTINFINFKPFYNHQRAINISNNYENYLKIKSF